jgi:phospholipase C
MDMKLFYRICAVLLFMTVKNANAQFSQDINGVPMRELSGYTNVEGSPFLTDQWSKGMVKLADGRTYKDVLLKYDEVKDVLYFQDKKEQTLVFVDPVREFKVEYISDDIQHDKLFRNAYKNIPNSTEKSFFEVLSDGTAQLLKRTKKLIAESQEYNSTAVVKRFDENVKYYIIVSEKVIPIKRDKKSILAALTNKQPQLESFIRTNNINLKNDEDLVKLMAYYNSL